MKKAMKRVDGDGIGDDTGAIQAVIDEAGATVVLAPRNYWISNLTVSKPTHIEGA